jgi:glycosyltransferase involved in cell wall biosynthesis
MNALTSDVVPPDPSALHIALWLDSRQLPQEAGFIYSLAVAAKAEGCRISVVAPADADLSFLPALGAPVLLRPASVGPVWLRSIRRPAMGIIDKIRKSGVDVVLQFAPRCAHDPTDARLAQELPVVRWLWDSADISGGPSPDRDAGILITGSQHLLEQCGTGRLEVELIRPGILGADAVRAFKDHADRPACMVCLDAISDYQAFADLLDACRRLMDDAAHFLLFLCDVGKDAHGVWKLSSELGLLDRVSFIPYRYDIDPLLGQADVYIQLTSASRINYTTLRAMARKIPVVANPGVNDEFCVDGRTCRFFERSRPDMLAAILGEMLAHRAAAREMAGRAAANVQRHYSMSDAVQRLIAVCRQASGIPLAMRRDEKRK